jgi:hypothetical protein
MQEYRIISELNHIRGALADIAQAIGELRAEIRVLPQIGAQQPTGLGDVLDGALVLCEHCMAEHPLYFVGIVGYYRCASDSITRVAAIIRGELLPGIRLSIASPVDLVAPREISDTIK